MRTRVYVAGPLSRGCLKYNINQGRAAATALLKAGYAPFLPHLSCFWSSDTPEASGGGFTHAEWLDMDLSWVSVSHALLRLPGESVGADMEVRFALDHDIPVFYDLDVLMTSIPPRICRLCNGSRTIDRPVICGPDTNAEEMARIADETYGRIPCPACSGNHA